MSTAAFWSGLSIECLKRFRLARGRPFRSVVRTITCRPAARAGLRSPTKLRLLRETIDEFASSALWLDRSLQK